MQDIDEMFTQNVDKTFYHYTGISSLLGISNSKCLWASNIYYMNDSREVIEACDILDQVIFEKISQKESTSLDVVFLKQLQNWLNNCRTTTYNIFVFSLSEEPSLLSQWRSYTPHGKGLSIGFSAEFIKNIMTASKLKLAKCIYDKEEQKIVLLSLVNKFLYSFNKEFDTIDTSDMHPSQSYHRWLEKFRGNVLQVLSIIKHNAFKEEAEWRLISPYYPKYTVDNIKYREGASMLVPYIELPLGEVKPYFEKVILGPSQHQNLSMSALSMFLSNQNLCNATVNCVLPYREW